MLFQLPIGTLPVLGDGDAVAYGRVCAGVHATAVSYCMGIESTPVVRRPRLAKFRIVGYYCDAHP